jgi:hypothetical protein
MSSATRDYAPPYSTACPLDRLGAALARNWWLIGLRSLLGLVFGAHARCRFPDRNRSLVALFRWHSRAGLWCPDDCGTADRRDRADLVAWRLCAGIRHRAACLGFQAALSIHSTSGLRRYQDSSMTPRSDARCRRKQAAKRQRRRGIRCASPSEEMIDESLKETFPASDPPSWPPARIGSPRRTKNRTTPDVG